jgi:glycosyltransferase involved in cell wall biosynthesis
MAHKISIIMPAYNEGQCIFENIKTTHATLLDAGFDAEIVAVDDGSPDNTLSEIERASKTFNNVVAARNLYNMGKGMALRNGFEHSTGEIIVFLDADLDLHPSQITNLLSVLEKGPYDVVVTSKHHPESKLSYPFKRKVASFIYYMFIKILFGLPVRDTQTGLKIFRRGVLEKVFHRLLVKTYAYDVELLATAVRFGYKIQEIPVVLDFKREMNWGRIKIGDVIKIFTDTLAIFYRLRVLRYYDVERPLSPDWMRNILIVFIDTLPPEGVIKGLTLNSNSILACMIGDKITPPEGIISFRSEAELSEWLRRDENGEIGAVGFLGSGYTPVGSWVKNAVRNFGDDEIMAVCGPVLPGKPDSFYGKISSMLYSSAVTAGFFRRLFSVRRYKNTSSGLYGNFFIRSSCLKEGVAGKCLTVNNGRIYHINRETGLMKYDPDIAVSKYVPPLLIPFLMMAASDFFREGRSFHKPLLARRVWPLALTFIMCFLFCGVFFVPHGIYIFILSLYFLIILIPVLTYFDPVSIPFFIAGAFLTHLAGAVSYPLGMLKGLLDYFSGVKNDK